VVNLYPHAARTARLPATVPLEMRSLHRCLDCFILRQFRTVSFPRCVCLCAIDASRYYYAAATWQVFPIPFPLCRLLAHGDSSRRYGELANIAMLSGRGVCASTLVVTSWSCHGPQALPADHDHGRCGIYAHPNALWLFGSKNHLS
jgi:hypothetical protein